jgi:hypothetical protein
MQFVFGAWTGRDADAQRQLKIAGEAGDETVPRDSDKVSACKSFAAGTHTAV